MRVILLFSLFLMEESTANPEVENGVLGQPEVRCGATSITVVAHTTAPFAGRLYVQGEAETAGCVRRTKGGDHIEFELPFGECGMRRQRTLSPRGVTYSFTLVVSFHPIFVTGTDRGFNVRCFFLESVKSLDTEVDVGRLTTAVIEQTFDLPSCTYSIHEASPTGPPVKYARVGDSVAHVWNCGEEAAPAYGMLIHSCYVDDGAGKRFELIDDRGCGIDRVLLPQIDYDRENLVASARSSIFKYADKIQVFFTCTVQLCFKKDGGCDGLTPPLCDGQPHTQHPDHSIMLLPGGGDHHERPHHREHEEGHPRDHEGHRGPPPHHPDHHPHRGSDEDDEDDERRPPPRFPPPGERQRPDWRDHRRGPPPPFHPRDSRERDHRGPQRGEDERDHHGPRRGSDERDHHGPPHREDHRGPPRDEEGRRGPHRGEEREDPHERRGDHEDEGERPPPPPRGLFPDDGLPEEIKNAFDSKFAPPGKEFFGPMDGDVRLDSPLTRSAHSAVGEKLLAAKRNSTNLTATGLDAALQAVGAAAAAGDYEDDLDDIEALLNSTSDQVEPIRYRTDFATSTLSTLFRDAQTAPTRTPPPSPPTAAAMTTERLWPESTTTMKREEEEEMIRVSKMAESGKDTSSPPPPSASTQLPFSSTGVYRDAEYEEEERMRRKMKMKKVGGWENDRTSRDSETKKKLETDLSVDVIVLPFEEDKPSTTSNLLSPDSSAPSRPLLCLSAVGSSLLLSAILLALLVVATVSFTIARRQRLTVRSPETLASKRLDLF